MTKTFKQFLLEEGDTNHSAHREAADVFMANCKQWIDVEVPLYRLSTPTAGGGIHTMRTRVPRKRQVESRGYSRETQVWLFNQPGWENYPDRLHSIFCSTVENFAIGEVDEASDNLLMIFPFDGVKIGITKQAPDFNFLNMTPPIYGTHKLMYFADWLGSWLGHVLKKNVTYSIDETLQRLREIFIKDGEFDPTCNGNAVQQKRFDDLDEDYKNQIRWCVMDLEERMTPEKLGVELVTSKDLELPGKTREAWFSGKYLSIPSADYKRFIEEVKALQSGKPLPERPKTITVKRAPT